MADLDDPITYLFVPADRPERFAKALASGADRVIIDLEDAVTSKNKTVGRNAVKSAGLNWSRIIIRINDVASSEFECDVSVLRRLPVQTIMVPKVDGQACLQRVVDAFDNARTLIPQIETVKSLFALPEILSAPHVDRVAFGHLDFALDLGTSSDYEALAHVRSQIVLQSRLAGKPQPIDSVTVDFRDLGQAAADARFSQKLGFGGKLLIHPAQVEPVREAFLPSAEDIDWAHEVLRVLEEDQRGAVTYLGQMIDYPVELRARRILAQIEKAS